MLRVNGIARSYGTRKLFSGVSFILNRGEKAALTGPNGAGKSTILDIVAGLTQPGEGSVTFAPGTALAYLRQGFEEFADVSVEAAACSVLPHGKEHFASLRAVEAKMSAGDTGPDTVAEFEQAFDLFESSGAPRIIERINRSLGQVGLDGISPDAPLKTLSGGQRSRVALAGIIAAQPDVLLLDEPTNHLDLPALEWLEAFVQDFKGAVLAVSHDRVFLDNTVTQVLEVDTETQTVAAYAGNYSEYVAGKDREQSARLQKWREQEAEIRRIRTDIQRMKSKARSLEHKRRPDDVPAVMWDPGKIARGMTRLAKSREVKLKRFEDAEERVDKLTRRWKMKMDLEVDQRAGDMVVRLEDLSAGYAGARVLNGVSGEAGHGERIALMGSNGTGKSTLLRIIAGLQSADSGEARVGPSIMTGYMPQEHTGFAPGDTPLSVVRAAHEPGSLKSSESDVRNFLHFFLFQGDHVFTPVERLSYGERARLYLAKLVSAKPNLLLLDEPLNHLDIPSRERFEEALLNYNGTAIAATHDRAFVDSWATAIWWLDPGDGGAILYRFMDRMDMERRTG